MSSTVSELIDFVKWLVQRRTWPGRLFSAGIALILASLGGLAALTLGWLSERAEIVLTLGLSDTPVFLPIVAIVVGLVCTAAGGVLGTVAWREDRSEQRAIRGRALHIVMELRGLRDLVGTPVSSALPDDIAHTSLDLDIRESLYDGDITRPERALQRLEALPTLLEQLIGARPPADVSLTVGGLAPVPCTFLTGVLIDDERQVEIVDWDRGNGRWRRLDAEDDGKRFILPDLNDVTDGEPISLCVSCSYGIAMEDVRSTLPHQRVVHLEMEAKGVNNHWSCEKQIAMGEQLLDVLNALASRRVSRIDLFLAGQSSVVLRFGRLYDRRNLPPLRVHQYMQSASPAYPWAVDMPVAGARQASVVHASPIPI